MSGEADGTFIPFGSEQEMDTYGDTGNQVTYSGEGLNKKGEQVFVSGILLPSGLDIKKYIQEDTTSIADQLKEECVSLGFNSEPEDKNVCLMLTRIDRNGFSPKLGEREKPGNTYESARILLINREGDYIVLFSRGVENYYVQVNDFYQNGKRYNCKLETTDEEGSRLLGYFGTMRYDDYRDLFNSRENLKDNLQGLIASTLRKKRMLTSLH